MTTDSTVPIEERIRLAILEKLRNHPMRELRLPTGKDMAAAVMAAIKPELERLAHHDARVTELLQANNRDMERRRIAEAPRDARQERVKAWVRDCFGQSVMVDRFERIMRVLEEATELAQAEGIPIDVVQRVAPVVYTRPPGRPEQEAGGVMVTMLAYAAAAGFSLDEAETAEIARIHTKTPEHFRKRQAEKAALGISRPPVAQ